MNLLNKRGERVVTVIVTDGNDVVTMHAYERGGLVMHGAATDPATKRIVHGLADTLCKRNDTPAQVPAQTVDEYWNVARG